jgi:hypothetical protein
LFQADLRKFRKPTFERKQMSTTIKRVALVAVAALGLGVVSVAPSQATINADTVTLSATTAAQTTAETKTATSPTVTVSFLGATGDSLSVTASLVSGPTGNVALPRLALVETSSAKVNNADLAAGSVIEPNSPASTQAGSPSAVTTAKYAIYLGTDSRTAPTKAGTYVVKLTPATVGLSGAINAVAQTITFTVTAAAALDTVASPATTTSIIAAGDTSTAFELGVDDVVTAAKTLQATNTNAAATIIVTQKNAAGSGVATTGGESLTVVITGPGSVAQVATGATMSVARTGARALSLVAGNAIKVFADGSAGVSTITVSNSAGTVVATETVTFYSTVAAKVVATVKKAYVKAGGTASTGVVAPDKSETNSRVFFVKVYDAAGVDMGNAITPTVKPTTATTDGLIGAAGVCTYQSTKTTTLAVGFYCSAPGVSSLVFGKANYTFTATNADLTTVTTTADVTFSDVVAKTLTITAPASAAVGQEVTVTLTATDKNGYPVADASYEGNASLTQGAFFDSVVNSNSSFAPFAAGDTITTVSGVATRKVYLPVSAGSVTSTWTLTGVAGKASGALASTLTATDVVLTVGVTNPGVDAATDAANEAAQAASDATDAALAAADAADAATTAVAALSAQVNKLVAALKAQITTLTNLVLKIQKKVRA